MGTSDVQELSTLTSSKLYPNPVTTNEKLYYDFEISKRILLNVYILDSHGRIVKKILSHRPKIGASQISFNTQLLTSGNYFLVLVDTDSKQIKYEKFIVN